MNDRANAAVDSIMHRKSAVSLQESTGCLDSFDTLFASHDVRSFSRQITVETVLLKKRSNIDGTVTAGFVLTSI